LVIASKLFCKGSIDADDARVLPRAVVRIKASSRKVQLLRRLPDIMAVLAVFAMILAAMLVWGDIL
jgi:hypothetical protein